VIFLPLFVAFCHEGTKSLSSTKIFLPQTHEGTKDHKELRDSLGLCDLAAAQCKFFSDKELSVSLSLCDLVATLAA